MESQQIQAPSVQIDPSIQMEVQEAVNELKRSDPGFFSGVSKIVGLTGVPFGRVVSDDPSIIHINIPKIKQEIKRQMGPQYNPTNPSHADAFKEALKRTIVETITHEHAHVHDYDQEKGFAGGEGVAEQAERNIRQKLYQNKPIEFTAGTTGIEPSTPGGMGSATDQYNITGNDFMAGGPNARPWKTRVQELLERLKKLKKQAMVFIFNNETSDQDYVFIWRVEKNKQGPWNNPQAWDSIFDYTKFILSQNAKMDQNPPPSHDMGFDANERIIFSKYKLPCAFDTPEGYIQWFDERDRRLLEKNGFRLHQKKAKKVWWSEYSNQVYYDPY